MKILVTGAAGFIGSHTCLELLQNDFEVVAVDNLSNGKEESLKRVEALAGRSLVFHKTDLRDRHGLETIFNRHRIDAVIHFAGLKSVTESVANPLVYYQNNVMATLTLCELMQAKGVRTVVFSSSATVYGQPDKAPIAENAALVPINPYGRTKLMIENILRDIHVSDPAWNIALLRYFNPVGAHPSGSIGEDPNTIPNNLFPRIAQVAVGRLKELPVYGNDYPTKDGTGMRDYIHVVDLAQAHLKALAKLQSDPGVVTYNLGSGKAHSVLETIAAFSRASGKKIPYRIEPRRPGDAASCYADPSLANRQLKWKTVKGLDEMCADTWRWQMNNPNGFA